MVGYPEVGRKRELWERCRLCGNREEPLRNPPSHQESEDVRGATDGVREPGRYRYISVASAGTLHSKKARRERPPSSALAEVRGCPQACVAVGSSISSRLRRSCGTL